MDRLGFFKHGLSSLLDVAQSIIGLKHAADSFTEAVDEALSNIKTDIGLHLPSLDAQMYQDPQGTICDIAEMGYTLLEVGAYTPGKSQDQSIARLKELADGAGLKIAGVHINKLYERPAPQENEPADTESQVAVKEPADQKAQPDPNAEWWQKALDDAQALGCRYVTMARMPDYPTDEVIDEYIAYFNLIGELTAERKMQFCFHPRKAELQRGEDSLSIFDRIAAGCDPQKVAFQIDTYEATEAGIDILELLNTQGKRVALLHIHDYGIVGESGKIDLDSIIAKGVRTGVRDIMLEVSDYSMPPKNCVERSLQNVQNLPSVRF
ncbi:MAG: sugar phosphate isomerase/epimerase [Alistipes sp.]|nr:sugar phosphate isomerase/epimerase [Alistipes sp.]MBQ5618755.1 sugar phosphate isomerase/epimerase [Alistipes sp.]